MSIRKYLPVFLSIVICGIILYANHTAIGTELLIRESLKGISGFYGSECTLFNIGGMIIAGFLYLQEKLSETVKFIVEICFSLIGIGTILAFFSNSDYIYILRSLLVPIYILSITGFIHGIMIFLKMKKKTVLDREIAVIILMILIVAVICSPLPQFISFIRSN